MFRKNVFGQYIFVRKLLIRIVGAIVYWRFNVIHRNKIKGAEEFQKLRDKNVLIVSNHQTYFADVSFFYLSIYSALEGFPNNIRFPGYWFCRKSNIYYVAAEETMKAGLVPRLLALTGAITVNRAWRSAGENVRRKIDKKEVRKIDTALQDGWVITFPQGTTKPFAKGRFGTAVLIKKHKPVVVPVVIDGFRRAFDKKGMLVKKKKSLLKMNVKPPMEIDYDADVEVIMSQIMEAIEQTEDYDVLEKLKKKETTE